MIAPAGVPVPKPHRTAASHYRVVGWNRLRWTFVRTELRLVQREAMAQRLLAALGHGGEDPVVTAIGELKGALEDCCEKSVTSADLQAILKAIGDLPPRPADPTPLPHPPASPMVEPMRALTNLLNAMTSLIEGLEDKRDGESDE
jgi:hypothetical protein